MKKIPVDIDYKPTKRLNKATDDPSSAPGRILKAAEDIFAEQGFKSATTREIAKRAGVNIATIHYYWGSKEDLWHAVIYNVVRHITELTEELIHTPANNLQDVIEDIIGNLVDIFADNPNYSRLLQQRAIEGVSPDLAREIALPILNIALDFIRNNNLEEHLNDFDPAMVLFGLQGSLRIFFQERDSVKAIFGEDPCAFSPAFRQKLKDLIASFAVHFAGLVDDEETNGKPTD